MNDEEPKVNKETGSRYFPMPSRWKNAGPAEISLKYHVENLHAFEAGGDIRFEWTPGFTPDEPEARDAQCRAGWNDVGYGFFGFQVRDGVARWFCTKTCD